MKKYNYAKIWRKKLKDQLEDLSSLEFQKKAWIEQPPDLWWDWADAVCGYFDDLLLNEEPERPNEGLSWHVKELHLTTEEANTLKPFSDAFEKYIGKHKFGSNWLTKKEFEGILSDPEWIKITQMAKEILEKIDFDQLP